MEEEQTKVDEPLQALYQKVHERMNGDLSEIGNNDEQSIYNEALWFVKREIRKLQTNPKDIEEKE